jgi:hypothetical protein
MCGLEITPKHSAFSESNLRRVLAQSLGQVTGDSFALALGQPSPQPQDMPIDSSPPGDINIGNIGSVHSPYSVDVVG